MAGLHGKATVSQLMGTSEVCFFGIREDFFCVVFFLFCFVFGVCFCFVFFVVIVVVVFI